MFGWGWRCSLGGFEDFPWVGVEICLEVEIVIEFKVADIFCIVDLGIFLLSNLLVYLLINFYLEGEGADEFSDLE